MGIVLDLSCDSVDNRDVFTIAEQCLHSIKAFSASHLPASGLRVQKELGGDTGRTADPRNIPFHTASCSAQKAEGRREWGMSGVMVFAIPRHHYMGWSPAFLEMAEHLPAGGKRGIDSLFCFVCVQSFSFTNTY